MDINSNDSALFELNIRLNKETCIGAKAIAIDFLHPQCNTTHQASYRAMINNYYLFECYLENHAIIHNRKRRRAYYSLFPFKFENRFLS